MTYDTLSVGALGTNCYIVTGTDGKAAVIDPGDNAAAIQRKLDEKGLTLEAILLTHAHFDHMGALAALVKASGAAVYCHRAEQPALTDGVRNLSAVFGAPLETVSDAVLLDEGDTLTVGTLVFTVLHTPGHTPGSCCYLTGDTLFSGDTLFCESVGRTDFPGGDVHAMKASLQRLLGLEGDLRVLPGHDEETTLSHERQYNPYIF